MLALNCVRHYEPLYVILHHHMTRQGCQNLEKWHFLGHFGPNSATFGARSAPKVPWLEEVEVGEATESKIPPFPRSPGPPCPPQGRAKRVNGGIFDSVASPFFPSGAEIRGEENSQKFAPRPHRLTQNFLASNINTSYSPLSNEQKKFFFVEPNLWFLGLI